MGYKAVVFYLDYGLVGNGEWRDFSIEKLLVCRTYPYIAVKGDAETLVAEKVGVAAVAYIYQRAVYICFKLIVCIHAVRCVFVQQNAVFALINFQRFIAVKGCYVLCGNLADFALYLQLEHIAACVVAQAQFLAFLCAQLLEDIVLIVGSFKVDGVYAVAAVAVGKAVRRHNCLHLVADNFGLVAVRLELYLVAIAVGLHLQLSKALQVRQYAHPAICPFL